MAGFGRPGTDQGWVLWALSGALLVRAFGMALAAVLLAPSAVAWGAAGTAGGTGDAILDPDPTQGLAPERLPVVVASLYPLYEWARIVGGEQIEVFNLTQGGADPRAYEPTPADVVRLQGTDVILYQGPGFQPGLDRVIASLGEPGPQVVDLGQRVALPASNGAASPEGPTAGDAANPYTWLDPVTARAHVLRIAGVLAALDPANASLYEARAWRYAEQLAVLHEEYQKGLAACTTREFAASQGDFAALAERYGLAQVPASTARAGLPVLRLNPITGLTPEQEALGVSYLDLMRQNLQALRQGLECR